MVATITTLLGLFAVAAAPALAQTATDQITEAAEALRTDPVYVHPDAEVEVDADRIRERIRRGDAGQVYVAVLPDGAAQDGATAAREIARALGRPGTYAAIVGRNFGGGSTLTTAADLADAAVAAKGDEGATAITIDFIDRVAERRRAARDSPSADGEATGLGLGLLALLVLGGGAAAAVSRKRRRERERAQLAEVKTVARDDLVALGDDIRALDLDVEMPDADPEGKRYYGQAVDAYTRAEEAYDRARRPEDLEPVTRALEEGRYVMTAAKARLAGEPVPEHRPPCFFDPRHGPSTEEVEWAPPGGAPRPVPVCAADAQRIRDGYDPVAREIEVGGQRTPYYDAPAYYGGYAGGFFGGFGGFLPGLLLGSMLGGWDVPAAEADTTGDWGGGDFGGGDWGGGDFGGGDFGGGDF